MTINSQDTEKDPKCPRKVSSPLLDFKRLRRERCNIVDTNLI